MGQLLPEGQAARQTRVSLPGLGPTYLSKSSRTDWDGVGQVQLSLVFVLK